MSKADVELLYGVAGGGDINGQSGKKIAASLNQISKKIKPKIQLSFDKKDLDVKIKEIKTRIEKILGSYKNVFKIQVPNSANAKATVSNKKVSSSEARQLTMYKNIKKAIDETRTAEKKFYNSRTKNNDLYIKEIEKQEQAIANLKNMMDNTVGYGRYPLKKDLKSQLKTHNSNLETENLDYAKEKLFDINFKYQQIVQKTQDWINRTKKIGVSTKESKQELEDLYKITQKPLDFTGDAVHDLKEARVQLNKLRTETNKTMNSIRERGDNAPTPQKDFIKALKNKGQSMISAMLIASAGRALMQVYQHVVELDTAVTNLQIATGKSREETEKLIVTYSKLGKQLGATTIEVADAANTWLRQGYSIAETNRLIENTMMLSKLGMLSSEEAAKALTSAMKGYKKEANEALSIVDKFTAVDMKAAISAGEIATAMAETATGADLAGVSMDKLIGYITAVAEVTQDAPESVGTYFKTLFARMGNVKAGKFVDDETGEALNDVEKVLNEAGIALRDNTGKFRNFGDVLDEVGAKWASFNDDARNTQEALATAFAGTRNAEKFKVLMSNYAKALEYAKVSEESGGTAEEKYQTAYLNSIEAKMNSLTATWQSFSQNILDSGIVKAFVDIINVIAEVLEWFSSLGNGAVGSITIITGAIVLLVAAVSAAKTKIIASLGAIKAAALAAFKSPYTWIGIIVALVTSIVKDAPKWAKIIIAAILGIGGIVVLVLKTINKAVQAFMVSNPIGWILLAITAVISAIQALIDALSQPSFEDLKEAAQEAKDAWQEAKDALAEIEEELEKISTAIDEINKKENLTLVDQQELDALKQKQSILQAEKKQREEEAKRKEKEAFEATKKAFDKYGSQSTQQFSTFVKIITLGICAGIEAGADTYEEKLNKILADWEKQGQHFNSEADKNFVLDYIAQLRELTAEFQYQTGDNLEDWQLEINAYLDEYYTLLDKYNVLEGNIAETWDSAFNRVKYKEASEELKKLADELNVTSSSLKQLYQSNKNVKEFVDYLEEIGLFAWNDTQKINGLVQQIRSLATNASYVSKADILTLFETTANSYDALANAVEEMEKNGVLSADKYKELAELFPNMEKDGLVIKTSDGFKLSEDGMMDYLDGLRDAYAKTTKSAQEYYDKVKKAYSEGKVNKSDVKAAEESLQNAIANQKDLEVVINTLTRTELIADFTEKMDEQSKLLEEQGKKYKEIIDIRKELLKSYKEELDYQKQLADKQKSVAELETKLALAKLDNSAAGRARQREIEQELESAQEDLSEFTLENAIDKLTEHLESEYDEYSKFIDEQVNSIKEAIENAAKMTSDALRDAISGGTPVETHHTGGFVNGAELNSHEQFAKLLNGELVVTPRQMSRFMNSTLPKITSQGGSVVNNNSPLVAIYCENINKDTMPELQKAIDKAVKKVKEEIDRTFARTGKVKSVDKFKM